MALQTYLKPDSKNQHSGNSLTNALFVIYIMALCWILLFKLGVKFSYMDERRVNLIPFSEFIKASGKPDVTEIILNVLIFIPFGVYTGMLFLRWSFAQKVSFFFFTSLMFEGLQFILRIGAFDGTDIVTNTLGAVLGLTLFNAIRRLFNNTVQLQKIINLIAFFATLLMISLLLLLKLNMLPVRYQ